MRALIDFLRHRQRRSRATGSTSRRALFWQKQPQCPLSINSTAAGEQELTSSFPVWRSPETHARRLLEWLVDHRRGEILSREIQAAYREMCAEIGWEQSG